MPSRKAQGGERQQQQTPAWDSITSGDKFPDSIKIKADHCFTPALSNFYPYCKGVRIPGAPALTLVVRGISFPTLEQAYQYEFAELLQVYIRNVHQPTPPKHWHALVEHVQAADTPAAAKQAKSLKNLLPVLKSSLHISTKVATELYKGFVDKVWKGQNKSVETMRDLLRLKFGRANPRLAAFLLSTGNRVLYENSGRLGANAFWEYSGKGTTTREKQGELGRLLEARREELREDLRGLDEGAAPLSPSGADDKLAPHRRRSASHSRPRSRSRSNRRSGSRSREDARKGPREGSRKGSRKESRKESRKGSRKSSRNSSPKGPRSDALLRKPSSSSDTTELEAPLTSGSGRPARGAALERAGGAGRYASAPSSSSSAEDFFPPRRR